MIDERDRFVPGYDLEGELLPQEAFEELHAALFATSYDADEEIRAFVNGWLTNYGERKRKASCERLREIAVHDVVDNIEAWEVH